MSVRLSAECAPLFRPTLVENEALKERAVIIKIDIITRILTILVATAGIVAPLYFSDILARKGSIPEKQVDVTFLNAFPAVTSGPFFNEASINITLTVNGNQYDNVYESSILIKNVGLSPILPTDIYSPIRISIPQPWQIVYAADPKEIGVQLIWKNLNDNEVEAAPALLNPGDLVEVNLFVTNPTEHLPIAAQASSPVTVPKPTIMARISNLQSFTETAPFSNLVPPAHFQTGGIQIEMAGWGLPYFIVMFIALQIVYVRLLFAARFLSWRSWHIVVALISSALLSMSGAEVSETYIFGSVFTYMHGINHWLNAPWILLNIATITFLYIYIRRAHASFEHQRHGSPD